MIYRFKRNVNFHLAAGKGTPAGGAVSLEASRDCGCESASTQTICGHFLLFFCPSAFSLGCVLLTYAS